MSRQMESHFINTGFPTESFIYLFEGLPHNYAELSSSRMMHEQVDAYRSMHTGSNKFEPSTPGSGSFYSFDHAHVEDDHVLQTFEEPEPLATPLTPESPEEDIRSHSNASSSQMFWQDNIDPDNMTYEELLDLGEAVGTQSRGLSQELISSLPTSKYKSGGFFSRKKAHGDPCVICQMDYKRGDRQMTLPCKHVYHVKCVTKWLTINKACPVCFCEVFGKEKS